MNSDTWTELHDTRHITFSTTLHVQVSISSTDTSTVGRRTQALGVTDTQVLIQILKNSRESGTEINSDSDTKKHR